MNPASFFYPFLTAEKHKVKLNYTEIKLSVSLWLNDFFKP